MRLTFTRHKGTGYDFSESTLAPIVASLHAPGAPGGLARISASVLAAANDELVRAARGLTFKRSDLSFNEAASIIAKERPHLIFISRCQKAGDGDRTVDVAAEGGTDEV